MTKPVSLENRTGLEIAVVGMAGRFPGANSVDEFWRNLEQGVESIVTLPQDELKGIVPEATLADPHYVPAKGVLADAQMFDAEFFGFSPCEAEITDPQHRIFLECAWHTLEAAGYCPESSNYRIGVFAGSSSSAHVLAALNAAHDESTHFLQVLIGNDKDFLPTRVSYKLNLKGPSVAVQTACSTSLIAVHLAVQSLLCGDCDMALAGGVSVSFPSRMGYQYQEGGPYSPDGHCRAFDAEAKGTVGGNGVACVLLKRLEDALADRDIIHAIIKGSAVNNDGFAKIGYTAPGIEGQKQVVRAAHLKAEVLPGSIGYIETHGTGTELGDPIEVAALTEAFQAGTREKQFCALGSLKTNVGHLDAAAGVSGLIKAALVVKTGKIPPSLHFVRPNRNIDFASSPFYVNTKLKDWESRGGPRRAGVSAFGIGGTNAHVVLEEPPAAQPSGESRPWQLLLLSARTADALENATVNLAHHLKEHAEQPLADVAYTLHRGRRAFSHRRMGLGQSREQAIQALETGSVQDSIMNDETAQRPVVFLFPGGGTQYARMGKGLYDSEAVFRKSIDESAHLLQKYTGHDLRTLLYPFPGQAEKCSEALNTTSNALAAIFITELALARLLISWGIRPDAMAGHSLGEYTAACLAGVIGEEDALRLIDLRARLLKTLPAGAMLSVDAPVNEVRQLAGGGLSIAAVNTHCQCVVSGSTGAIVEFENLLPQRGIGFRRLRIDVPGHSSAVSPIMDQITHFASGIAFQSPGIRYISNVSGTWITADQIKNPRYWATHLRETVRFADTIDEILKLKNAVFVEVGPGTTLGTLISLHAGEQAAPPIVHTMRHPDHAQPDAAFLMTALGRLWLENVNVDWRKFYANESRNRVPLPVYPFERRCFSLELPAGFPAGAEDTSRAWPESPERVGESRNLTAGPRSQPKLRKKHARPALSTPYIACNTDLEKEIASIWQELFHVEEIGLHDNFFELGGSSLIAIRFIARVLSRFGVRLRTHDVFKSPAIAQLAELVAAHGAGQKTVGKAPAESVMIEIQPGISAQTLILLPPIGGSLFQYHALARFIEPSLRVYGVAPPALDGESTPITTVEQEAEFYLKAARSVCPAGPYYLAGASYGGIVAFEMAQQLQRNNEEVRLLALFDTPCPTEMKVKPEEDAELTAMLVRTLLGEHALQALGNFRSKPPAEQIAKIGSELKNANLLPADVDDLQLEHIIHLWKSNARAMLRYCPQPYKYRAVFFRAATRTPGQPRTPEIPWIDLVAGGLEVHVVSGDHYSILQEPHALAVGEKLRQMIFPAAHGRQAEAGGQTVNAVVTAA